MSNHQRDEDPVRVLFVDDTAEKSGTKAHEYAKLLREDGRFQLKLFVRFTAAEEHIRKNESPEDFVILDIILPVDAVSVGLSSETAGLVLLEDGMRTKDSGYLRIPVLVVTNDDEHKIRALLEDYNRVWVRHKGRIDPFRLVEEIDRIRSVCARTD